MNPSIPYVIGIVPGITIAFVVFLLYERANKQLRLYAEFLQRQLNSCLSKMMAVDYEKLAELDIRARAAAQSSWFEAQGWTPEFSDMDVLNPDDYKVGKDAKQTS
jgi:hypothetical protein